MSDSTKKHSRLFGAFLWFLAVLIMFAAVIYQRRTGPTYPKRGTVEVGAEVQPYRLIRSEETIRPARVSIPDPGPSGSGTVYYKRYPTDDPFTALEMEREDGEDAPELVAYLPPQPAAGKLEYYLEIEGPGGQQRIPSVGEGAAGNEDNLLIRFKDPVPAPLLIAHVVFMFFSVLIGMRAGLAALLAPSNMRRLAWITLTGLTIGGMILGPFVQKYAFGEYWTGFPWGYDLTDNKTLIMFIAWLVACSTVGLRPKNKEGVGRAVVIAAAIVMTGAYLIPHSMRGSELDYEAVDRGVDPSEAVGTSDR